MRSEAKIVTDYIDDLPTDRKLAISKVRNIILSNLPKGIEEVMNWGMISYQIPIKTYPNTYNGQPLMYAALASQKNHMAVYLSGIYSDEKLRNKFIEDYQLTGKKSDLGKSCVRFRKIEDIPLELIGSAISALDVNSFIELYNDARFKKG